MLPSAVLVLCAFAAHVRRQRPCHLLLAEAFPFRGTLWEQGAGGSNPLTPTILSGLLVPSLCGFCVGTLSHCRCCGRDAGHSPVTQRHRSAEDLHANVAVDYNISEMKIEREDKLPNGGRLRPYRPRRLARSPGASNCWTPDRC